MVKKRKSRKSRKSRKITRRTGYVASVVFRGKKYKAFGSTPTIARKNLIRKIRALIRKK